MSFWKYLRAYLIFDWLFGDSLDDNHYDSLGSNHHNSYPGSFSDDWDYSGSNFNNDYLNDNHNSWDDDSSTFLDDYDDFDMMDDF
ncbi:MAG: hypothetical protein K2K27_03980 [Muribaculaceae bacterium]|nr:hypothetical protein [Muribaculaceae bacterium]